jgi:hypothetical protein
VLLHSGDQITPSIYIDFLMLDGGPYGPHNIPITIGFSAHNMVPSPPPPNDGCAYAIPACPGSAYNGSTSSATVDGSTNCGTSNSTPDVWYKYTPATSSNATFSLCGSGTDYDSVLSLHSACPGTSGNSLSCDDDGCGAFSSPSTITRPVVANWTYYIRISGYSGATGNYTFAITGPACAPDTYTLTAASFGQGSVLFDPPGGTYPPNTVVTVTANAAAGWHFDHWTGDLSGASNPATITMNANKSITAVFGRLGDLNCDGSVDFGDINAFVSALTGYAAYHAEYPACLWLNADCNLDGVVNFADINPFVDLLAGR